MDESPITRRTAIQTGVATALGVAAGIALAGIPAASHARGAPQISLVSVVGNNTGSGSISNGQLSTQFPTNAGNYVVVIVGINQALHPVSSVKDSSGTVYTEQVIGKEGGSDVDAWVCIWTGRPSSSNPNNQITVSTRSSKINVIVLEYSGVTGIGKTTTNWGRSSLVSVTLSGLGSASAVVMGGSNFTKKQISCGFTSPFSGGTVEECMGTSSTSNNVGNIVMDNTTTSGSVSFSAAKTATSAWAAAAVELLA